MNCISILVQVGVPICMSLTHNFWIGGTGIDPIYDHEFEANFHPCVGIKLHPVDEYGIIMIGVLSLALATTVLAKHQIMSLNFEHSQCHTDSYSFY